MPRITYTEPVEFRLDMAGEHAIPLRYYSMFEMKLVTSIMGSAETNHIYNLPVGETYIDSDGDTWTRIHPTATPED